jgi:hypothetical protein
VLLLVLKYERVKKRSLSRQHHNQKVYQMTYEEAKAIVLATGPVENKEKLERTFIKLLVLCNLDINHQFLYAKSPKEANTLINQKEGTQDITYTSHGYNYGNMEAIGLAYLLENQNNLPITETLMDIAKQSHFWFLGNDYVIICDRPTSFTISPVTHINHPASINGEFDYDGVEYFKAEYADGWIASSDLPKQQKDKTKKLNEETNKKIREAVFNENKAFNPNATSIKKALHLKEGPVLNSFYSEIAARVA